MSKLPVAYAWLADEPGPRMIVEALALFGTVEAAGDRDNPTIMEWASEIGVRNVYSGDDVPWCGLFAGVVAKRAGKMLPDHPLWALDWRNWGRKVTTPMLGDVCIKTRTGGGHVAIYVGEDADAYHLLGGNQSDQVCIRRFSKDLAWSFRRPAYTNQPANVRRVWLAASGEMSSKES